MSFLFILFEYLTLLMRGAMSPHRKATSRCILWLCKLLFTKKHSACCLNLALKFIKPEIKKPEREYSYVGNMPGFCDLRLPEMQLMVT